MRIVEGGFLCGSGSGGSLSHADCSIGHLSRNGDDLEAQLRNLLGFTAVKLSVEESSVNSIQVWKCISMMKILVVDGRIHFTSSCTEKHKAMVWSRRFMVLHDVLLNQRLIAANYKREVKCPPSQCRWNFLLITFFKK